MRRVAWYQKRAQLNLAYRAWQAIQGFKKPEECRNAHCLTSKSHDVTPLYCYGNEVKKTVAILSYKTLKWRLYCCTKQRTVERSRLIILSLCWPFWCTPPKNSEDISPQVREPGIFLLWIWILGLGIWITVQGLLNRTSDRNLESKSQRQRIRNQLNTFLMQKLSLLHELCIAADHVGENNCLSILHV